MIFQIDDPVLFIIGILVGTLVLFLMLYVAEMYIISKTVARDRKLATLLAAFLGVLVIPYIAGLIGEGFGLLHTYLMVPWQQALGWTPANYLMILVPIFAYLMFWAVCKFLIGTTWEKSGWVALVGLLLLYLIYTIFPIIPQELPFILPL